MNLLTTKHMETLVKPIRPEEVLSKHQSTIPSLVVETINDMIVKNGRGGSIVLFQDDIVAQLVQKGLSRGDIFENGWLDIEGLYRSHGWKVEYDKPGYNESYKPKFTFSKKRGG